MKTILTLAALGSWLVAQDPVGALPHSSTTGAEQAQQRASAAARQGLEQAFADPELVLFDRPLADGPLWAVGRDYKASFDDAGFTFVGRPQPGAAEVQPLRFTLASVRAGGEPLVLQPAVLGQFERRLVWDRGALVETVDVAGRGVEQVFTFASLPARGDLVLDLAVATALRGETTADGIRFTGSHDQVTYSQAIAIDADGDRIAVPTTWASGRITIRVPAEFVAQASFPLVVDPVVTALPVANTTQDLGDPDVAWDATGQVWGVVFSRFFGGTDWDCYLQRVSDGVPMQLVGTPILVDGSSIGWHRPRIANLQLFSEFGVVAQVRGSTGPWQVWSRMVANSGNVVTNQFPVTNTTTDELHPDIGGDPTTEVRPAYFAVVWEHAHNSQDIHATQLFPTGGTGSLVRIAESIWDQKWPAISKSNGGGPSGSQCWGIVWQETNVPGDENVFGSLMLWNGVLVQNHGNTIFTVDVSGHNDIKPQVSSPTLPAADGSRRLLVTYERTSTANGDIVAACLDGNGAVRVRENLCTLFGDAARQPWQQYRPHVDCDGDRFFVSYYEVYQGNTTVNDTDTRMLLVAEAGNTLWVEEGRMLAGTMHREFNPRVASRYSGSGLRSPRACIVNDRDNTSSGFAIDAYTYDSLPLPSFATRGTGCGNLPIVAGGSTMLGGAAFWSVADHGGLAGFVVGWPADAPLAICPGCTLGVDGSTLFGSTMAITFPLERGLIGLAVAVQGFEFGGGPCLQQIHLSDTVDCRVQ
jgi:hypothetical protein